MQYGHFASKLMTAGEANKQIKASLSNKETLAQADLLVKAAIQRSKKAQKKAASKVS